MSRIRHRERSDAGCGAPVGPASRGWSEQLGPHDVLETRLHRRPFTLLRETPQAGSSYGCSPRDALKLLHLLPARDLQGLDLLVFRRRGPDWGGCKFQGAYGRYAGSALIPSSGRVAIAWPALRGDTVRPPRDTTWSGPAAEGRVLSPKRICAPPCSITSCWFRVGHWVEWRARVLDPAARARRSNPERSGRRLPGPQPCRARAGGPALRQSPRRPIERGGRHSLSATDLVQVSS